MLEHHRFCRACRAAALPQHRHSSLTLFAALVLLSAVVYAGVAQAALNTSAIKPSLFGSREVQSSKLFLFPKWRGSLLVGALKFELVSRLTLDGDKVVAEERFLDDLDERIRDVRQGPDGALYLLTDSGDGRVIRIEPSGS